MTAPRLFDRQRFRRRRDRAAATLGRVDFLIREAASRLLERLADVRRDFPLALDLGCHSGQLGELLAGSSQVGRLIQCDLSPAMVRQAKGCRLVADEEALPFGADRFDLVLSCFSLHWLDDLPGTLAQIRHCLRPDGLFLGVMAGGSTLAELRTVLLAAEAEVTGGAGPRVAPAVDLRDAGMLLQRAGLALPMADVETLTVTYDHPLELLRELGAMGETGGLLAPRPLGRATLARAIALYQERFESADGRVPATFQLLTLAGWKPDPSQPQPAPRGSGSTRLAEALAVPADAAAGEPKRP
jgi:SAM-dependent methyltransferase